MNWSSPRGEAVYDLLHTTLVEVFFREDNIAISFSGALTWCQSYIDHSLDTSILSPRDIAHETIRAFKKEFVTEKEKK